MAEQADIQNVIDNIQADYTSHGWSDVGIAQRLDTGSIWQRVVSAYWRARASDVITLVNISESGSSRSNDSLYPRYKSLADDWDAKALAIENAAAPASTSRLSSFPIKRV